MTRLHIIRYHGTPERYKHGPDIDNQPGKGCRCPRCRKANTREAKQRRLAIAQGQPPQLTNAKPVQAHLRHLMAAHISYPRISELSGIPRATIGRILYGHTLNVRTTTAHALYSVTIGGPPTSGHAHMPAIGAARRARALIAIGWPPRRVAARMNVSNQTLLTLLHSSPGQRIRATTAVQAVAAYNALWNQNPLLADITAAAVKQARRFAARNRWAPPGAWDDDTIDHPDTRPDLGAKTRRGDALVEDSDWILRTAGLTLEQAAERLGVKDATLRRARERAAARAREQVPA